MSQKVTLSDLWIWPVDRS